MLQGLFSGHSHSCKSSGNEPFVVGLGVETLKRGEATIENELKVAQLTLGESDSGQAVAFLEEVFVFWSVSDQQILEDAVFAVRSVHLMKLSAPVVLGLIFRSAGIGD